jgi:hypothetical protein
MRTLALRAGVTLTALTLLACLGPQFSCGHLNRIIEQATGQTPRQQVADLIHAIARGDRDAALASWTVSDSAPDDLMQRREHTLEELLGYGPGIQHRILNTEWWTTCCDAGVTQNPRNAGGAVVQVSIGSPTRNEKVYAFYLLVPGGYWGDAAGNPVRTWEIVDIAPEGEPPLVFPLR